MFFPMSSGVPARGESVSTVEADGVGAGVFFFIGG